MNRVYIATWRIEINAESPHDAARKARQIVLDPETTATIWEIGIDVDLSEDES